MTSNHFNDLYPDYIYYSLSRAQVFRWHKSFLKGWEQMEDEPCVGRPSTSKTDDSVERVRSLVRSDRWLTLRMISSVLNLNRFTVHQILTQDLDIRNVCAKMVPKNLTTEQANWKDVCLDVLDRLEREPEFFSRLITRWWIMDFAVRPRDKTPKSGLAHCKLSPSQESENEKIQNEIDAHLFFWKSGDRPQGMCHQDKLSIKGFIGKSLKDSGKGRHVCDQALHALGCCTTTTPQSPSMNFFAEKCIPVVPQPPYSPDLSPCDFFLFFRLKNLLKGSHFGTLDNIQKSVTDELKGIPAEAFRHCYGQWKQRLRRCVAAQGNYFEGNNLDL